MSKQTIEVHEVRGRTVMLWADVAELYGIKLEELAIIHARVAQMLGSEAMLELTDNEMAALPRRARGTLPKLALTAEAVLTLAREVPTDQAARIYRALVRSFLQERQLTNMAYDLRTRLRENEAGSLIPALTELFDRLAS